MRKWKFVLVFLTLLASSLFFALIGFRNHFHLITCNVGQGDAVLAFLGSTQILIDGGPDNKVLDCLSSNLPFWDRKIEVVILTHPEEDHYKGLIEVFRRYQVDYFLASAVDHPSPDYQGLKDEVQKRGITVINPKEGDRLVIGKIYLDIYWPSEKFLADEITISTKPLSNQVPTVNNQNLRPSVLGGFTTKQNLNGFSLVTLLTFGNFKAFLPGDIQPPEIEEITSALSSLAIKEVNWLKIPHHGSKNGLTIGLLEILKPKLAVISVGKNSYGHPNKEIIEMLNKHLIKVLRTDQSGDIEVISDGEKWWLKEGAPDQN